MTTAASKKATSGKTTNAVAKVKPGVNLPSMKSFEDEIAGLKDRLRAATGDKIKISNKQFKLPTGDVLDFLDVVIVDFIYYNAYYESAYTEGVIVPPNCFALSFEPKGMVPSAESPDCQDQGCDGCWANEFGSSGKGKACQNRVLMAVLPTDATMDTPFTILDISPTAVKGFSSYVRSVAVGLARPPYGVVTHIECNPAMKHDVAVFSDPVSIEDGDFIAMLQARRNEARERLATEPDVSALKAANDAKPKVAGKPAAKGRMPAPATRKRA